MRRSHKSSFSATLRWGIVLILCVVSTFAQLIDKTKAPNLADEGIYKSYTQQIGAGRGDLLTPDSSAFIISRDPFRSIRRGRQLFQRKFTRIEGQGPLQGDGWETSTRILPSAPGSPIVAPPVTVDRGEQREPAATSPHDPIAAMRRIYLVWASKKC